MNDMNTTACGGTKNYFLLLLHIFLTSYIVFGKSSWYHGEVQRSKKKIILELISKYQCLPALWIVKLGEYSNREEKRKQYEILFQFYFYFIFLFFFNKNVKSNKSLSDEDILQNDDYKIKMQMTIDEFF